MFYTKINAYRPDSLQFPIRYTETKMYRPDDVLQLPCALVPSYTLSIPQVKLRREEKLQPEGFSAIKGLHKDS